MSKRLQSIGTNNPNRIWYRFHCSLLIIFIVWFLVNSRLWRMGILLKEKNWFPEIEPLFKLLSYENVPPYLKVSCDFLFYIFSKTVKVCCTRFIIFLVLDASIDFLKIVLIKLLMIM